MNPILLHPTDVLFFRDGRPMSGSLSGHGAAWPMPNVISHAFHAALHRAKLDGVHIHRRGKSGQFTELRDRKFGSLNTAGPFPVCTNGAAHTWFFPRPLDATVTNDQLTVSLLPIHARGSSNLPAPLKYAVGNQLAPTKNAQPNWWSEGAWSSYLGTPARDQLAGRSFFKSDGDFCDAESTIGIAIDPTTGTAEDQQIYSASYLRLRDGWRLGTLASAPDKDFQHESGSNDLIRALIDPDQGHILVGGQQRVCTATLDHTVKNCLPLPLGQSSGFTQVDEKFLVKWVLLTPAIFPEISHKGQSHPGGWLPNWIHPTSGKVMLLDGPGKNAAKRKRVREGQPIQATLVAAITGKPLPVTGWALPNSTDRAEGGAKSTHLAVPAGSVYYFECDNDTAATNLANALNWHGAPAKVPASVPLAENVPASVPLADSPLANSHHPTIQNRRSTLMGEKGFGLGVCGSWQFHTSR